MSADPQQAAPPREPIRMKFLLRSGNAFMVDGVVEWKMERDTAAGRITSLKLTQSADRKYAYLLIDTLDIAQIEGVLILPPNGPGRRANERERSDEH